MVRVSVAVAVEAFEYMLSRLPAPQVSVASPGHGKLQSVEGAETLPELIVFPQ